MARDGRLENEEISDLVQRCRRFAIRVILLLRKLPQTPENREIGRQVIRSSGSVGANYVEAKYARTRTEFFSSAKISLREIAESLWWLFILREINDHRFHTDFDELVREGNELANIFAAIALKGQKRTQ